MIDLTIVEAVILGAAFIIAGSVTARYIPRWAVFVLEVGIAFYWVVRIVTDGVSVGRVAAVAMFSGLAAYVWWRDLRSRGGDVVE